MMDPLLLPRLAKMIGIKGGIIAVLLVALGVTMWRADSISEQREALRTSRATEIANHAVTAASLDALDQELRQMVSDGELRADRLAEAREAQEDRTEALQTQLDRIIAEGATVECVSPDAVLNARGL